MAGQSASSEKNQEHGVKLTLSEKIARTIENLASPVPKRCCIYKVPDHIRKSNKDAYTPQVISIGPFHHNNPKLQTMESFKLRYLKSFMERAAPEMNLEGLVENIKSVKKSVRECYSESTEALKDDDFVKMILVDATFIIEYFWKNWSEVNWTDYDKEILEPWLCNRMQMDFILLENQLPFFIIEKIYEIALPSPLKKHPFIELTFKQFEYYNVQQFIHHPGPDRGHVSILHFTDLLRHFCLPPLERRPPRDSEWKKLEMHSSKQLDEVGLKFKKSKPSKSLSPLELKYANGELEIPRFQLDDTTEVYARNLIALEKCQFCELAYITDYYTFLSFLVQTGKDLDVLVREQIVDNLQDGIVASSMINKLSGEKHSYFQMNSHYRQMAEDLNKFYNNPSKLAP